MRLVFFSTRLTSPPASVSLTTISFGERKAAKLCSVGGGRGFRVGGVKQSGESREGTCERRR